jgi:adenylylsulfate kinase
MKNKCIWFLGLSGAGKSTLSTLLKNKISKNEKVIVLDGDLLRTGLNNNLGFTDEDRIENGRRTAEAAKLFLAEGYWVLVALITPLDQMRDNNRKILGGSYFEIFVDTPLSVCQQRDPKGLYSKVASNQIQNFTGVSAPFDIPKEADLSIFTKDKNPEECVEEIYRIIFS